MIAKPMMYRVVVDISAPPESFSEKAIAKK